MIQAKLTHRRKIGQILMGLTLWLAVFGVALRAAAEPKGPNGEKCDSSETGVKHDIKGQTYTCDKCVYTKCDTSGGQISNCQTVTHYSNCVAAMVKPGGSVVPVGPLQNVPVNPPTRKPPTNVPATGGTNKQ